MSAADSPSDAAERGEKVARRSSARTTEKRPATSVDAGVGRSQARTEGEVDWKDKALRLQAKMQTYRQRQRRWAEGQVVQEKAELLMRFLDVLDNLEQALNHIDRRDPAHQGVQLAYDSLLQMLIREDVERIFAKGRVFDPELHEAVAVVPARPGRDDEMRVAEVMSPGYRYKDRILRPAKVVVAK